jgi:hypothetical protein
MCTDQQGPSSPAAEGQPQDEIRALWLRLLRLVAAEVATRLQERGASEVRGGATRDPEGSPGADRRAR